MHRRRTPTDLSNLANGNRSDDRRRNPDRSHDWGCPASGRIRSPRRASTGAAENQSLSRASAACHLLWHVSFCSLFAMAFGARLFCLARQPVS